MKNKISLFAISFLILVTTGFYAISLMQSDSRNEDLQYPAIVDLGEREYGQFQTAEITLKNTGRKLVRASRFMTSCGCGKVQEMKDGQPVFVNAIELQPGESRTLQVRFMLSGLAGTEQSFQLFFDSSLPGKTACKTIIRVSKVLGGVTTSPTAVALGRRQTGLMVSEDIEIMDYSNKDRKFVKAVPDSHQIKIVTLTTDRSRLAPHVLARIQVQVTVPEPGYFRGVVQLYCTDLETPAFLVVDGEFSNYLISTPDTARLPSGSKSNPTYSTSIVLNSLSGKPFTIESKQISPEFSVEVSDMNDFRKKVTITLLEKYRDLTPDGSYSCRLTVLEGVRQIHHTLPIILRRF